MADYNEIFVDKIAWGEGPWSNEPDKIVWVDPTTGLDCMIVRNPELGNLCGYVGVPLDSKLANVAYDDLDVNCHGGLTYGAKCEGRVCHISDYEVYWFGFDCAHFEDMSPGTRALFIRSFSFPSGRDYFGHGTYRDVSYVRDEVTQLAAQIKELL